MNPMNQSTSSFESNTSSAGSNVSSHVPLSQRPSHSCNF
jgi:hypothetical protein